MTDECKRGLLMIKPVLVCNINCVWFSMCLDAKDKNTRKHQTRSNCECCCIGVDDK